MKGFMMNATANIRLELPLDLEKEIIDTFKNNEISFELIPNIGGLRAVSAIAIFEIAVGVATLIQTGLQIYEFLRQLKKKTNRIYQVVLETKPKNEDAIIIRVEINPNIPRPVVTDRLLEMQQALF